MMNISCSCLPPRLFLNSQVFTWTDMRWTIEMVFNEAVAVRDQSAQYAVNLETNVIYGKKGQRFKNFGTYE